MKSQQDKKIKSINLSVFHLPDLFGFLAFAPHFSNVHFNRSAFRASLSTKANWILIQYVFASWFAELAHAIALWEDICVRWKFQLRIMWHYQRWQWIFHAKVYAKQGVYRINQALKQIFLCDIFVSEKTIEITRNDVEKNGTGLLTASQFLRCISEALVQLESFPLQHHCSHWLAVIDIHSTSLFG